MSDDATTEGQPDRRVQVWFDRLSAWRDEGFRLREILLSAGLDEVFKWRGPCYVHAGDNVVFLGVFKDCASLGFFKGVLLIDPDGLLKKPGENSRIARVFKARSVEEIERSEAALRVLLAQAMKLAEDGVKVDLPQAEPELPEELITALEEDAELAEAFAALTPGRQRGWAITIGQPKQAATRVARIAKARPQILEGKGIHDR